MRSSIVVQVPATTANMGPGFDCIAMALDMWNLVRIEVGALGFEVLGEGSDLLPANRSNLVYRSFCVPFAESGEPVPAVRVVCENRIPVGRGLGSSAAAILGGLVAGSKLCQRPLTQNRILELAAQMEGHSDNVAAALLGGCQIVVRAEKGLVNSDVPIPDGLRAIIFVPDNSTPTSESRAVLTQNVELSDAVYNVGRVALLVRAFATGDLAHLSTATEDRLHHPARETKFPAMKNIFQAALSAGAHGVFLSGAGPSVLALATSREVTIGYEMADAAAKSGVEGRVEITTPSSEGVRVI